MKIPLNVDVECGGAIVGKALEPLGTSVGRIQALVTLQ